MFRPGLKTGRKIKMLSMQGVGATCNRVERFLNRQSLIEKNSKINGPAVRWIPPVESPDNIQRACAIAVAGIVILLRMCWRYSEEGLQVLLNQELERLITD